MTGFHYWVCCSPRSHPHCTNAPHDRHPIPPHDPRPWPYPAVYGYRRRSMENAPPRGIADDTVTEDEHRELAEVQGEFNISDHDSSSIYEEECRKKMQEMVDTLLQRRRVSPDDEQKLKDIQRGTGVDLCYSASYGLKQFRHFWDVENAPLPELTSPIALQKTERLYYKATVDWYEERTRTTYVSYAGISTSFRIMKGVTLRSGMICPT